MAEQLSILDRMKVQKKRERCETAVYIAGHSRGGGKVRAHVRRCPLKRALTAAERSGDLRRYRRK